MSSVTSQNQPGMNPYDVIVVGAGPAGATAAYYLARGMDGHSPKRVALLDKATFPRDKYCGDAWCSPALDILEDMGVLQQIEKEGLFRDCTSGGFVSPSGESYVSTGEEPPLKGARCYAIKRFICDERIARKAAEQGAALFENADFASARLHDDGFWTVTCKDGREFRAKMLVAADGATSQVARSLGIINTAPEGVASRQYIKGGTHNFKSGGVLFYPDYIIPGYVALFLHYNDDIDIGVYIIPGGAANPNEILDICQNQIANDPFMRRILGPNAEALEKPRVASLRTGGVERSTGKQFLAVGDAAGQTDPITGEGIHTGMKGGKLAAQRIHEMASTGDFSATACDVYHQRWMDAFGKDFPASAAAARLTGKYPLLLDAANVVAQLKGDAFMADFGATMTGVKPKSTFLRPGIAIPLGVEVVRQFLLQKVARVFPSTRAAYEARAVEKNPRRTAFANACLIDPDAPMKAVEKQPEGNEALDQVFKYAGTATDARRVTVVYATEFGFSAEAGELLCEALLESGENAGEQPLSPRYIDAEHFSIIEWSEVDTCLLLCSTAGDGEPPQKAREFIEFLQNARPDLSHTQVAILAMGDSSYPHFCGAGLLLADLLAKCGAKEIIPVRKVDAEDMAIVNEWIDDMLDLLGSKKQWIGRPEQAAGELLPAKAEGFFTASGNKPRPASSQHPFMARLAVKSPLADTSAGGKETWHIEVDVSSSDNGKLAPLVWEPGDALGVLPVNPPDEVDAVLKQLSCAGSDIVDLPRNRGRVSLRDALSRHLDIKNLKHDLLNLLLDIGSDDEEKARLQAIDADMKGYAATHELQDILRDFPVAASCLNAHDLVGHLHPLSPRYYSIASSRLATPGRVALAVATVRFSLPGGERAGVASTCLNERMAPGDSVAVFVHKNCGFRLPAADSGRACVMIGAGTGMAPYRGFMQELEFRAVEKNATMQQQAGGCSHLLFFGCRHEKADFLYAGEWSNWQSKGALALITAFSRDQQEKIYVQDRLRENGSLVWERMQRGDHFYVCGDATHMAGDVEKALLDIILQYGNKSADDARKYLATMAGEQRYQKDVWA